MSKLAVKNLYKIFGSNPKNAFKLIKDGKSKDEILKETGLTVGVNNVSFEVYEGETFVVMGLSGSGKSTVIRCLNRLIEPTSGCILLDGKDVLEMNRQELVEVRRKSMSMVFQNFALLPNRKIITNVEYGLEVQGTDKKLRRQKALDALKLVGLKGYEDQYPDQLSGGMKQRVGLARALANDPEILLMDEAFSALDPLIRSDMQDELIDLQQKMKKTIVFITHDLNEALKLGDRIMLMKDGEVIQIGRPEDILSNPANEYVERFVKGVDKSDTLTAADIMVKPWTTVNIEQGPHVAMKEFRQYGIETLFVVKEGRRLAGTITLDDTKKAIKEEMKTLHGIVQQDAVNIVQPDFNFNDLIELTLQSSIPVAVVDDSKKLLGVIVKSCVLRALISERSDDDV